MVRGPSGKRGNDKVAPIAVVPGRPADGTATGAAPRVYLPRPAVEIGSEVDGVGARYALADEIVATFVGRGRVGADAAPVVAVRVAVKGALPRDLRRTSRTAQAEEMVRLHQAALRRARSSACLSRPLHPSRRHLEQSPHRARRPRPTFRYKHYAATGRRGTAQ